MNPVDYAINRVMLADIDEYLLKLAFDNPNANYNGNWYNIAGATTVQQGIREQVIHRLVLPACNVNGGKTEFVELSGATRKDKGNGAVEVNVPDQVTGGRKIISVSEVYLATMNSAVGVAGMAVDDSAGCERGSISDMTGNLIDSLSPSRTMPITYTNVHMTGNNAFVIFGLNNGSFGMTAKCLMEYDSGMSSIHTRHYENFAELVEFAVKSHIYRKCRRATSEAVIRSGVPLDDIKNDIEEYRDAFASYKEYLTGTWARCMAYSDTQGKVDSIRMSVPRRM